MRPRDAATVVLVRDGDDGPEVCLLRRNPAAVFAGGAHVFPGGAVDDGDRGLDHDPSCRSRSDDDASRALGLAGGGLAYWVAAVRECFEEAGILLARRADGSVLDLDDAVDAARFADHRGALLAGSVTLAEICRRESLTLALDGVYYLSHWVTPDGAPRRFDTRFFVAQAPPTQPVVPDPREVVADLWATPSSAHARHAAGEVDLILPTSRSLDVLGRFADAGAILDALAAAEADDRRGGPTLVDDAGGRRRRLPGDPGAEPALVGPPRAPGTSR
jgi:8-oxo-dGTP pyrophosphatase MutT (NUDIX family)